MTNEAHWDYILTKNYRKEKGVVKQKDNLENHAKQITQYLQAHSVEEPAGSPHAEDTSLPGVKVHLSFPEKGARKSSFRSSMRKLPRKASSMREKKKNSESEKKNGARKSTSSPPNDEKPLMDTAAHDARGTEHVPIAEPELENHACGTTREDMPIMTSLNSFELMLVSADKGDLGTMQVLFDKPSEQSKALCVTRDDKGETPLHKTAKGGYLKCLKFLVSLVPDEVSCTDHAGMTPAAHAANNGHMNCLKWLVEETSAYGELAVCDGQTGLLHHAAKEGKEQCLNYLLTFMAKRKITTEIVDAQGQTPLHLAARTGHLACVQTLVEHGADVLAKDHEGLTSTNVAYLHKQAICSRYLLMAESCWILASRVATLFREVSGYKKENKELKKTIDNLKSSKKYDLPNRPETVGAHTNDTGGSSDNLSSKESDMAPIGPRNFPDGESPKSTFTEADKQRPQIISQKNHVINRDGEVKDAKQFKVIRTTSLTGDTHIIPTAVSTNSIGEIPPSEKVKAKEIAMVTHQLMSSRHLQMIQEKKTKETEAEAKKPQTVDDSVVEVVRRTTLSKSRDMRPKSLCENQMMFMRSATDIDFAYKNKQKAVLERRASCTELADAPTSPTDPKDNVPKERNFWDKVGARRLLSRKKSLKSGSDSGGGLSDLQTVSTDKILELYARESRGSCTRLNSFIQEENETTSNSLCRRSVSAVELKSPTSPRDAGTHASFRESRTNFKPLSGFRMSERFTPSTSAAKDIQSREHNAVEKKVRPVAKPRLKLRSNSTNSNSSEGSTATLHGIAERTEKIDTSIIHEVTVEDTTETSAKSFRTSKKESNYVNWDGLQDLETNSADNSIECTDV